jgi:hypothetical protein
MTQKKIMVDGCEIELTAEQLQQIEDSKKPTLLGSTKEVYNFLKPRYYINGGGNISATDYDFFTSCKSHVPTKEDAESILAYAQLLTVVAYANQVFKGSSNYEIHSKNSYCKGNVNYTGLSIHSIEGCKYIIATFPDLLKKYYKK